MEQKDINRAGVGRPGKIRLKGDGQMDGWGRTQRREWGEVYGAGSLLHPRWAPQSASTGCTTGALEAGSWVLPGCPLRGLEPRRTVPEAEPLVSYSRALPALSALAGPGEGGGGKGRGRRKRGLEKAGWWAYTEAGRQEGQGVGLRKQGAAAGLAFPAYPVGHPRPSFLAWWWGQVR